MSEAYSNNSKTRLPSFPSLSAVLGKKTAVFVKRQCIYTLPNAPKIDYKDVELLKRHISERGKLNPSRVSNISYKNQRKIAREVKRARFLALLPYINQ